MKSKEEHAKMLKLTDYFQALGSLGLEATDRCAWGTWNGYAVSAWQNQGQFLLHTAVRIDKKDKALPKSLKKALNEAVPKGFANCVNAGGDALTFTLRLSGKEDLAQQFRARLDAIVRELRSRDIRPADTCQICRGSHPESLVLTGSAINQPVHRSCLQRQSQELRDKAEDNQSNGSYLSGFAGAVLGMLAGLIPNVLLAVFTERIFALLFALVPLASMWGYRKFRGRQNAVAIVIVVVLSLLSVLVMEVLIVAIFVMQQYSAPFGVCLRLTLEYLFSAEGFPEMLKDSAVEFFFMALGLLIAWRGISGTNQSQLRSLDAALETVRPNPNYTDLN